MRPGLLEQKQTARLCISEFHIPGNANKPTSKVNRKGFLGDTVCLLNLEKFSEMDPSALEKRKERKELKKKVKPGIKLLNSASHDAFTQELAQLHQTLAGCC